MFHPFDSEQSAEWKCAFTEENWRENIPTLQNSKPFDRYKYNKS